MIGQGLQVSLLRVPLNASPWTLRGHLYTALARRFCRSPGDACPACKLFNPTYLRRDGKARDEVRPVVIRQAGERSEILLFGRATEYGADIQRALPASGFWVGPDGQQHPAPVVSPLSDWIQPVQGAVLLRFLSPLRLEKAGSIQADFSLDALVRSLSLRLHRLRASVGDGVWDDPEVDQATRDAQTVTVSAFCLWREVARRYSSRQHRTVWLDGLVGWARLENVRPSLGRLLAAGRVLHAGKGAVFGCGWLEATQVSP